MRQFHEDTATFQDVITEIQDLTREIEAATSAASELVDRRLAAIRRLHELADRHVILADAGTTIRSMTSARTPPFISELALMAILETGGHGATLQHVASALHHCYDRRIDFDNIRQAVLPLVRQGRVLDRGTRYFAPDADLSNVAGPDGEPEAGTRKARAPSVRKSPTVKSLIVERLENGPKAGMRPAEIRDMIAVVHQRHIPMTSLYPVVRQLERAGRVARNGRTWILVDRSAATTA